MACNELEFTIVEYVDNALDPAARADIEAHLAGCPACQQFARELRELDAAFTAQVKRPQLSIDFAAKLQRRIQAEPVRLSDVEIAERKRQYQAEYEAGLAELKRHPAHLLLAGLGTLRYLALVAGIVLAAWLLWKTTPAMSEAVQALTTVTPAQMLICSLGFSLLMIVAGLFIAFPRVARRYLLPA